MKLNLKKLVKNELLVPHLDAYQEAGKFPPVWNVEIRNYKEPDPHFHPSGDCFTDPVQLYMEKTGKVKRERPGYALRRIFDVGHMWHGYIQEIVKEMKFVEPHNVEKLVTFDYKMNGISWMGKGSIDLFDVQIPNRGGYIVDIKTMNDEEFDTGPKEETLKKWEAQLNCYYHWSGLHQGFILAVRKGGTRQRNGKPANEFREIPIEFKPHLLDEIYERWTQAQKYITGIEKVKEKNG